MDLCKLRGCKRPDTVHNLYFKRFPVQHEKDVIEYASLEAADTP